MTTRYGWVGLEQMVDEIDRVVDAERIVPRLDAVLAEAFSSSQQRISAPGHQHAHETAGYEPTGALLASGRAESDWDAASQSWVGDITYGSETEETGAAWEVHRGGEHDMFATQPAFADRYLDVIHDYWEGKH